MFKEPLCIGGSYFICTAWRLLDINLVIVGSNPTTDVFEKDFERECHFGSCY